MQESRFLSLRAKAREIKVGPGEEQRLRGELDDVERKLAIFEQSGHTEILKSFQKRKRQQRDVEVWEESWTGVGEQLREVAAEIVPDLLDETSFDSDAASDNELQRRAAKTHDHLNKIRKAVEVLASQADDIVIEWQKSRDESSWKQSVEAAAQAYQELTENLSREGAGDPAAYGELVQRRQVIEQRLSEVDERKKQVDDLNNQADAHLQHLLEIRRELTASRRSFLNSVLSATTYMSRYRSPLMVPARRSKASFADCSKERMGRLRKTLDRRMTGDCLANFMSRMPVPR